MRPLPWILALLVLAAVAVTTVLLLDEGDVDAGTAVPAVVTAAGDTPSLPAASGEAPVERLTPSSPALLPVVEEVQEARTAMPESYRRALGGFTGRIVESSGDPVPNLHVQLAGGGTLDFLQPLDLVVLAEQPPALDVALGKDVTGDDGRFRFTELEPRTMSVMLIDPGGSRANLHVISQSPETGRMIDLGDIVLPECVTLTGRVVDEAGEGIPGVRVRATDLPAVAVGSGIADYREGGGVFLDLEDESPGMSMVVTPPPSLARMEHLLPIPTTDTDGEGYFVLDGVRPGLVSLVIDHNTHPPRVTGPHPTGPAGGELDLGSTLMEAGVTLTGRVVDDQDEPVPGAQVMGGNRMTLAPVAILRPPVVADEEGRFRIEGLRPGEAFAVARRNERADFTPSAEVVAGADEAVVRLVGQRSLTLALVDEDQEPITEVRLLGRNLPDEDGVEVPDFLMPPLRLDERVSLDEDARLVISDLDPGVWEIVVHAPGFALRREPYDLRTGSLEEQLVLEPEQFLEVLVLREGSDEPVEYASVTAYAPDRGREQPLTGGRTDAEGRVELHRMPPGRYALEVAHPALAVGTAEVVLPDEPSVTVRLVGGGSLSGYVVDAGAPPAMPVMVMLVPDDAEARRVAALPRFTTTDLEGYFRFDNLEPCELQVSAREQFEFTGFANWWEPFAMTPLAEEDVVIAAGRETEVTLVAGSSLDDIETGWVQGELIVNGQAARGWKVRTWGKVRRSVSTGEDGRFDMGRVASGEVTLIFSAPGASLMTGGAVDSVTLELETGQREWVTKEITTGSISGYVVDDRTGLAVEGALVNIASDATGESSWMNRRRASTTTDRAGRFSVDTVSEGNYTAWAEAEDFARSRSEEFEVVAHRPVLGLEIRLKSALRLAGTVVLEGVEDELEWMWLTAESAGGNEAATRVEVDDGSFVLDNLSPGDWTFTLHASTATPLQTAELRVDEPQEGVMLVFAPQEVLESPFEGEGGSEVEAAGEEG